MTKKKEMILMRKIMQLTIIMLTATLQQIRFPRQKHRSNVPPWSSIPVMAAWMAEA